MTNIILPNTSTLRPYQQEAMAYFDNGGLRGASVWHRRAGKDFVAIHQIAKMAHKRRGLYYHCLPTQRQGRKVVWETLTKEGHRLIDMAFPSPLRKGNPNSTEMRIPLKCGSNYQVVGSDNYSALIGSNPVGVVFSEWSLTDPRVWDFIRPILVENGGWAWFIYTPRGYNHGFDIAEIAKDNPEWFYSRKTVDDTHVLTPADIQKEADDGMPKELIRQEFYCDFSAANVGAVLGGYIEAAEKEGRILDEDLYKSSGEQVMAVLDIGFRDTTAVWYVQVQATGPELVGYDEAAGLDAGDWTKRIKNSRYDVGKVWLPHDARNKTFASKHSVLEQFLGAFSVVSIVPSTKIFDRINAARTMLPYCRFSRTHCERGLMALREWSFQWDDVRKVFSQEPLHNWASHGGDAYTYLSVVLSAEMKDWSKAPLNLEQQSEVWVPNGACYTFTLEQLHEDAANDKRGWLRI
jgi:hypothetical protein